MLNLLRNNSLIAVVIGLLLWTPLVGFGQSSVDEIKQEAQAAKLTPELLAIQKKEAPKQKSVNQKSGNLRQAATIQKSTGLRKVDRTQVHDGLIAIEAIANIPDGQTLLNELQAQGLQEGRYYKWIVFGYFPIEKLDVLRTITTLHVARPAYAALKHAGKVTSQGDKAMRSDIARQTFSVTGVGSKVGVMSDSYNSLKGAAAGVASGDLPPNVQVIRDISPRQRGTDEGRAMAEIVHDVAPGADIAFATAYETQIDFALGILNLAAAGCNIIVDDVKYFAEPFFQDGILAQVVDYVVKELNVTYFSSAGNEARQSYESGFHNSGTLPYNLDPSFGHAHAFDNNGTLLLKVVLPPGGEFFPILQWKDPFYTHSAFGGGVSSAKTDLDILVFYNGVFQDTLSSLGGNIGYNPVEGVDLINETDEEIKFEIAITKYDGPDPSLIKWVDFGSGETIPFTTQSSTLYGHNNAEGAIAVGAARWTRTPEFNSNQFPSPVVEYFSSAGGTPILFTTYGQPVPPTIRLKPEIVAPDGANTTFFGQPFPSGDGDNYPNFFGTSAAAPHAAAVAALLQERAHNSMSRDDILKRLESTATDMDDPLTPGFDVGFDYRTGYGFIQADKALMIDGQPLAVIEPLYDCLTRKITFRTAGGDGSPITFVVPGVKRTPPSSTTVLASGEVSIVYRPASTTGIIEEGVIAEGKPIVITAIQNGVTTTYTFDFIEYCSRPREFALIEPLYDCATGNITFRTVGGDGTPITYFAPGIQRSSPTDPNGTVEAGLRYDPRPLTITATQSGVTVSYTFNFVAYCSSRARVAANEPGSGLQVSVLGNPIAANWVEVEVKGVQGQPLKLRVNNTLGELTSNKAVDMAESVERHKVLLGRTPGLYLLQVSTPTQTKTIKIVRQ